MEYKEVIKMIEESEKRVDEILKAARLERNEKPPMSDKRFEMVIGLIGNVLLGSGILIAILSYFYLISH